MKTNKISKIPVRLLHRVIRDQLLQGLTAAWQSEVNPNFYKDGAIILNYSARSSNLSSDESLEHSAVSSKSQAASRPILPMLDGLKTLVSHSDELRAADCASLAFFPSCVVVTLTGEITFDFVGNPYFAVQRPWYKRWMFWIKLSNLSFFYSTSQLNACSTRYVQTLGSTTSAGSDTSLASNSGLGSDSSSDVKPKSSSASPAATTVKTVTSTQNKAVTKNTVMAATNDHTQPAAKHRLWAKATKASVPHASVEQESLAQDGLAQQSLTQHGLAQLLTLRRIYLNSKRIKLDKHWV